MVTGECRASLGCDLLGCRFEYLEPRKLLAPEKLDLRQIGEQDLLRLLVMYAPLSQVQVAACVESSVVGACVLRTHARELLFQELLELLTALEHDILGMPECSRCPLRCGRAASDRVERGFVIEECLFALAQSLHQFAFAQQRKHVPGVYRECLLQRLFC